MLFFGRKKRLIDHTFCVGQRGLDAACLVGEVTMRADKVLILRE
jgi:hypothetical protein